MANDGAAGQTTARRPTSETALASITIAFAFLNFILLTVIFGISNAPVATLIFDFAFNFLLLFVGWLSLKARPASRAQQLAGAWFFAPFLGNGLPFAKFVEMAFNVPWVTYLAFAMMGMLIWAICLALKQSRMERVGLSHLADD
jgi:hypothetical protein